MRVVLRLGSRLVSLSPRPSPIARPLRSASRSPLSICLPHLLLDPPGVVGLFLAQRGPLTLVEPVEILAPALDQVIPAPHHSDQFPQRTLGPPDPEPPEHGTALPIKRLPHLFLPFVQLGPFPPRPGLDLPEAPPALVLDLLPSLRLGAPPCL